MNAFGIAIAIFLFIYLPFKIIKSTAVKVKEVSELKSELNREREMQLHLFIKRRTNLTEGIGRKSQNIKEVQSVLKRRGLSVEDKDILDYWSAVAAGNKAVINNENYFNDKYTYDSQLHINAKSDERCSSLRDYDFDREYYDIVNDPDHWSTNI